MTFKTKKLHAHRTHLHCEWEISFANSQWHVEAIAAQPRYAISAAQSHLAAIPNLSLELKTCLSARTLLLRPLLRPQVTPKATTYPVEQTYWTPFFHSLLSETR